jgi:tetratricopeptide (TPR) repeat protein
LALQKNLLLTESSLKEAFTAVKLANGKDNGQRYGLGWIISQDTLDGDIVKHDGGVSGGRSILLKNHTMQQTIILFDNHANNVITLADDALKILNGLKVVKPKKSGAKAYGIALANGGVEAANKALVKIRKDTLSYYLDENELNSLGYAFWGSKKNALAEEVFKTNTLLFPSGWNTYDSYGELLLANGKRQEAMRMYKKSVELNPQNENGINILKKLSQ